jgi:uncharacterized protein (TIGR04255 family)
MNSTFPIRIPERLPARISPCPIVEAIFEVRFASSQPWDNIPGLLYAKIHERYPTQQRLPLADLPDEFRRQDPGLRELPLLQFHGDRFVIQAGPRCVSLVTRANAYPGWALIREELEWMIDQLRASGFVQETERIGVRYIDFFDTNVFEQLLLHLHLGHGPVAEAQTDVTTILKQGPLALRVHASNAALTQSGGKTRSGSVLDVDAWFGALDVDYSGNGMQRFTEAHDAIKGLFFGLMKPEFLASLNPEYP